MLNDLEFMKDFGAIKNILSGEWCYQICHNKERLAGIRVDELQDGFL